MCGIAGIYQTDPKNTAGSGPSETVLDAMAEQMAHRGPDDHGLYIDDRLGFAHRRLSIIDLTGGHQPMQTIDGDLALTFNGEIFNFIELRESLEAKGYQFVTQSDTEVILHLYREYDLTFPSHLNGQFAIGLWDRRKQTLLLVRDRVGICPLYYFSSDSKIVFASEIKALAPAFPGKFELDPRSLDHIFTGWTCISPATIFKNVFQVTPGNMLIIDRNGNIEERCYWNLEYPVFPDEYDMRPEQVLIDELHERLLAATELRLRADVPVGGYLSGGLDSSVLVSLMHQHGSSNLRTFSLGFSDPALDETSFQDQVINHLGAKHTRIGVGYQDIAQQLVQTIWHTESPILRTAPVPMGILSKLVHNQGYRVVLTGEGADEVLGGYDIFKEAKVRQFWAKYPESKFRPLLLNRLYPYLKLPKNDDAIYLKQFFGLGLDTPDLLWHSHLPRWVTTAKAKLFFSAGMKDQLNSDYETLIAGLFPPHADQWHWFHRAQYLEIKTLMSGYLLTSQGDRMLARNSVEGRFPYLDHTLIEFANRLHPKVKMKAMKEKFLLKKMAHKYLPPQISQRTKQPYRAPDVSAGQNTLFGDELGSYLTGESIANTGMFDPKKVSLLLKKVRDSKAINISESQALTGILTTQILYNQFC